MAPVTDQVHLPALSYSTHRAEAPVWVVHYILEAAFYPLRVAAWAVNCVRVWSSNTFDLTRRDAAVFCGSFLVMFLAVVGLGLSR